MKCLKRILSISMAIVLAIGVLLPVNFHTVEAAPKAKISATKKSIEQGSTTTLKVTGTSKKLKWSTSNESVVALKRVNGKTYKVTGKNAGTATITVTASGIKLKCAVTVKGLAVTTKHMNVGSEYKLTLKNAGNKATWSTSSKSIVAIKKVSGTSYKLTAKKAGTATVTAKVGKKKYTCKVYVSAPKQNLTTKNLQIGASQEIKLTGVNAKTSVKWTFTGTSYAKFTKVKTNVYKAKALKAGTATAKATVNGKTYTYKIVVPKESDDSVLTVQMSECPYSLDPVRTSFANDLSIIMQTLEGLTIIDENEQVKGGCAKSWEQSTDGLTWTFHLRDGLKWSDGTALTAADFVYSWQRPINVVADYSYILDFVEGSDEAWEGDDDALQVKALDAKTLQVKLSEPCMYFDRVVAHPVLLPVQRAAVERDTEQWSMGKYSSVTNGAFHLEALTDDYILLQKNPYYWNQEAIELEQIKVVFEYSQNSVGSMFDSEEVLLALDVPSGWSDKSTLQGEEICSIYYASMNLEKECFQDVKVRKALSLAIDREYLANTVLQGKYSPAYNLVSPVYGDVDGTQFIDNANDGQPYISKEYATNLEEARDLMSKAGYSTSNPLEFTYITNDAGDHVDIAEYLQYAFSLIYVDMKIEVLEWNSFIWERKNGNYDMARNGWIGDHSDASDLLQLFCSTSGNNDGRFNSALYDDLLRLTEETNNPTQYSQALHQAEDILMENMVCIPLLYYKDRWLQNPKVNNIWHTGAGFWYLMYGKVN